MRQQEKAKAKQKKSVHKNNEKLNTKQKIEKKLNKKTNFKVYELFLFGLLIIIMAVLLTVFILTSYVDSIDIGKTSNVGKGSLDEFEEVYDIIKSSYYKKVDNKKLIDGAINGMLETLEDPHTSYFNKSETDSFNEVMNGSFEGIGVEITSDSEGNIIVVSVFKNSPANEVGIKFNDRIIEVNGKETKEMTTTDVVALIKDKNKATAKIKVNRNGEILSFDVEKRIVEIESVESEIYNKNGKAIGYLIINNFANNTYDQFKEKLEDLEAKGISGLIVDVRGNSGGYLHSVTSMLELFLPQNAVIYQISDNKTTTKYTATTSESRNYPIAVLVNKASASASEILAVSLKESYGAAVIGTYTYGKGTVQTTKDLSSGGMIKYTIQKWLSPLGNWINEVGVEPTVTVELSENYELDPKPANDNQLQKAIEHIANKVRN